ncbi:ATP synthase beta subunit C-terminal domain-containing protein, partial [Thiolapillus sp.]
FWALSKSLADARHYPSVSWTGSFSDAVDAAARWWSKEISPDWQARRDQALDLLARAEELSRIINLVGVEALSPAQRWSVEAATLVREALLQQSALDEVDSYCSPQKQFALLDLVMGLYQRGGELVASQVPVSALLEIPAMARLRRAKNSYGNEQLDALNQLKNDLHDQLDSLAEDYAEGQA